LFLGTQYKTKYKISVSVTIVVHFIIAAMHMYVAFFNTKIIIPWVKLQLETL